jgi:hypothetical protein
MAASGAMAGRALLGDFTFTQPDPIKEFGVPVTVGLSIGVVVTVVLSGLSERRRQGFRRARSRAAPAAATPPPWGTHQPSPPPHHTPRPHPHPPVSGLTLGLLSLDRLDLEVMLRTGTPRERRMAARLAPIVKYPHWVLATLVGGWSLGWSERCAAGRGGAAFDEQPAGPSLCLELTPAASCLPS